LSEYEIEENYHTELMCDRNRALYDIPKLKWPHMLVRDQPLKERPVDVIVLIILLHPHRHPHHFSPASATGVESVDAFVAGPAGVLAAAATPFDFGMLSTPLPPKSGDPMPVSPPRRLRVDGGRRAVGDTSSEPRAATASRS
jgi:hypothetical protein